MLATFRSGAALSLTDGLHSTNCVLKPDLSHRNHHWENLRSGCSPYSRPSDGTKSHLFSLSSRRGAQEPVRLFSFIVYTVLDSQSSEGGCMVVPRGQEAARER